MNSTDPFGNACLSHLRGINGLEIIVHSDHAEDDVLPVDYLFRSFEDMPFLEQMALKMCAGKILDIGAGAGCHSKWLIEQKHNVTAVEQSPGAVTALKQQGISNIQVNFFDLDSSTKYDTLLVLMNGTGIAGTLQNLPKFLKKCKDLLNDRGQVLIDSSDIRYLYEEEDGSSLIPINKYYGEVKYQMSFNEAKTDWFEWLYIDFLYLQEIAQENGMNCKLVFEGNHYEYLAQLTVQ